MIYHIVTAANDQNPNLKAGLYSLHYELLRDRKIGQPIATVKIGKWPAEQREGPIHNAADVVDRILGFRVKKDNQVVFKTNQPLGDKSALIEGPSGGLSYGLFIYDAIFCEVEGRDYEENEKEWVFATGKIEANGMITAVGDIYKKLKLVLEYLDKHACDAVSFLYPAACETDFHAAVDALKKEQGEQLIAAKLKRFKCILGVSSLTEAVKVLGIDADAKEVSLFLGLQSFQFEDRKHFAGREQTVNAAINKLIKKLNDDQNKTRSGVLLLTGLNGSGKSSLAKAGILPELVNATGNKKHPCYVSDNVIYPKHGNTPQPIGTLSIQQGLSGFIKALISFLTEQVGLTIEETTESIKADPNYFIASVSQQLENQKDQSLVMIIDQLEEVFQWPGAESWEQEMDVCDTVIFFDLLNRLVRDCQGLIFITTLRSEFSSRFDRSYHFKGNSPETKARETALTTFKNESSALFGVANDLNGEQWSSILSKQLEWAGLEETIEIDHSKLNQTGRYIETRLVGDLLKDVMKESHALPLASFCLQYLYEEAVKKQQPNMPLVLTWRDYVGADYADAKDKTAQNQDRIGLGLIAKKAEEILNQALILAGIKKPTDAEKSALASTFFMAFIEKAEAFELLTKSRLSDEKLKAILNKRYARDSLEWLAFDFLLQGFIDSHLLIKEQQEGVTTYQIAHDSLISKWQRVKQWFNNEKAFIVWVAQANTQYRLWEKSGKRKPLLEGDLLESGKKYLKDKTKDLSELEGYLRKSLFNVRRKWASVITSFIAAFTTTMFLYSDAVDERNRAELLLDNVRNNLVYMNYELRDVLKAYVPTKPRVNSIKQIDALSESLNRSGSKPNDERVLATVLKQKADMILLNGSADLADALPLVNQAIKIGERLLKSNPNHRKWIRDLSVSYYSLAKIETKLGNVESAMLAQQLSYTLVKQLASLEPENSNFKDDLSTSILELGRVYLLQGNSKEAIRNYEDSLQISLQLTKQEPDNLKFQSGLASSYENLAYLKLHLGNFDEALNYYTNSLNVVLNLVEQDPANMNHLNWLSNSYAQEGYLYERMGNIDSAKRSYESSHIIIEQLVKRDPNKISFKTDYCSSLMRMGGVEHTLGEHQAALRRFEQSSNIASELVIQDSNNTDYKQKLIESLSALGIVQSALGLVEESLETFKTSLKASKEMADLDAQNPFSQKLLSNSYKDLGFAHEISGNLIMAKEMYEISLDITEKLIKYNPEITSFGENLPRTQNHLGHLNLSLDNYDEALKYFEESLTMTRQLLEREPNNFDFQNTLSDSYEGLGAVYIRKFNSEAAQKAYKTSKIIVEQLLAEHTDNFYLKRNLFDVNNGLALVQMQLRNWESSISMHEANLVVAQQILKNNPGSLEWLHLLSNIYDEIGRANNQLLKNEESFQAYKASFTIRKQMVAKEPNNKLYSRYLSQAYDHLGDGLHFLQKDEDALKMYEESLFLLEKLLPEKHFKTISLEQDLSELQSKIGTMNIELDNYEAAFKAIDLSLNITKRLIEQDTNNEAFQRAHKRAKDQLSLIRGIMKNSK